VSRASSDGHRVKNARCFVPRRRAYVRHYAAAVSGDRDTTRRVIYLIPRRVGVLMPCGHKKSRVVNEGYPKSRIIPICAGQGLGSPIEGHSSFASSCGQPVHKGVMGLSPATIELHRCSPKVVTTGWPLYPSTRIHQGPDTPRPPPERTPAGATACLGRTARSYRFQVRTAFVLGSSRPRGVRVSVGAAPRPLPRSH
jgi:hypothetical protein